MTVMPTRDGLHWTSRSRNQINWMWMIKSWNYLWETVMSKDLGSRFRSCRTYPSPVVLPNKIQPRVVSLLALLQLQFNQNTRLRSLNRIRRKWFKKRVLRFTRATYMSEFIGSSDHVGIDTKPNCTQSSLWLGPIPLELVNTSIKLHLPLKFIPDLLPSSWKKLKKMKVGGITRLDMFLE